MYRKNYNVEKTYSESYTRVTVAKNGSVKWLYHFKLNRVEPLSTPHIKGDLPEYIRERGDSRLVYVEDVELRERIVLDASKIEKSGRPEGSKDSYKRTRKCFRKEK